MSSNGVIWVFSIFEGFVMSRIAGWDMEVSRRGSVDMVVSDRIDFYLINLSSCHGGPFSNRWGTVGGYAVEQNDEFILPL